MHDISRRSHKQQMQSVRLSEDQQQNAKIARNLRSRLFHAIRNKQKAGSAVQDLGCSIEELKKHLESKFQPGMNWENYGYRGWHIDHIKPLSLFNLEDYRDFKEACHYSNLQPLWSHDNFKKSNSSDNKRDFFIVCGVSGSGKSWVCRQLAADTHYVSYDEIPREQHYFHFLEGCKTNKPILYDPFRGPTTIFLRYASQFNTRLIVIEESKETIIRRIKNRGGKPNIGKIEDIIAKIPRWKHYAEFCGTSSEVLEYLRSQITLVKSNEEGDQ